MRLFVAVALPDNLKEALRNYQQEFKNDAIRFIPEENLHLSLHFLGDTLDAALPDLTEKLKLVAQRNKAFTLTFQETAPGPQLRSPRLIWTRFQEHPDFAWLATDLGNVLGASPGAHGKFIPHITIARFRKDLSKPKNLPVIREEIIPELVVQSFSLWNSKLQSPHPVYTILEEFNLKE